MILFARIQQRKRNRMEELRSGKEGYLTSSEFQKSILLHGCGDCANQGTQQLGSPKSPRRPASIGSPIASGASSSSAHKPNGASSSLGASSSSGVKFLSRNTLDSLIAANKQQRTSAGSSNDQSQSHAQSHSQSQQSSSAARSGSMDVVDLTCDSSDEEAQQPGSPAPTKRTRTGSFSGAAASFISPVLAAPQEGAGSQPTSSSSAKKDSAPEVVDMSRSRVLHKLAQLLDDLSEYQEMLGCNSSSSSGYSGGNGNSNGHSGISSSGGSSSSSASAQDSLRQRVHDVSIVHSCSTQALQKLAQLRPTVSRLLLLEVNAAKFYPKTSSAYLLFLARRIDKKLACRTLEGAVNCVVARTPNGNGDVVQNCVCTMDIGDDCIFSVPVERLFMRYNAVVEVLTAVSAKFERGMYKLPQDGHLVPALFREPRLACFAHALASSIDTDGIEVVDAVSPQDMVSYRDALQSSDDESVQVEPSPYNSDEDD